MYAHLSPISVVILTSLLSIYVTRGFGSDSRTVSVQCALDTGVQTTLCQAVSNYSLNLTCTVCGAQYGVMWMYGNSGLTSDPSEINQFLSKETNRSIVIPQDVLVKGRYTCFCSKVDLTATAGCFEVDLHSGMVPNFTVNVTEGIIPTEFSFHPETVYPDFGPTGLGTYCINATAQGYPNVAYKWMYVNSDEEVVDASSDFCLSHPNGDPRILCFTPTPDNVDDQRSYTCNVSNIVGSITGSQVVIYPGNSKQSDWFLRKHESQTTGTVSSEVAYCAAYQEAEVYEIQYLVCSLPNLQDYSPNTLACLYAQDKLNCCACGEANCSLDVSTSDVEVTDQHGVPTTACKVNASRLSGSYACIARKYVFMKGMTWAVLSAPQYLANFTFAPAPIHSGSNLTLPIWSVAVVLSVLGLLVLVFVLTIVATGIRFYHRRRQRQVREVLHGGAIAERDMNEPERRPLLQQGGRVPRHDFGSLQLSHSDEERPTRTLPIPTEEGDSPMKSVMVASQVHKPARIKVIDSNTKQEINESIVSSDCLPNETTYVLKPGNTYNVRMDNTTVKIVAPGENQPLLSTCSINYYSINEVPERVEEQQENDLRCRVRRRHQHLINSLCIDEQLLAALHERELLTELQRQEIHTRLERSDPPLRTSSYVIGSVVFHWPESVFDSNMEEFSKALSEHSDSGNKRLGEVLSQMLNYRSPD